MKGAKKLGIDIAVVGFDSDLRKEFIKHPHSLFNHVSREISHSRTDKSFARMIMTTGIEIEKKFYLD